MERRGNKAVRAAHAARWAYVLLLVAIGGFLCLFMMMPGHRFLLFGTGLPDTANIRSVRGLVEPSTVGAWNQVLQGTDVDVTGAIFRSSEGHSTLGQTESAGGKASAPSTANQVRPSPLPISVVKYRTIKPPMGLSSDFARLVATGDSNSQVGDESVQGTMEDLRISEAADMISTLLENRTLAAEPSTAWLMGLEVHKTPAEWQAEYLRLHEGGEDINFQSSGHVSPWFGDFMKPGAILCSL
jgi:hypothetical protein